ncbi:MAG: AI-2E family transporter [Bacillota bacterium]
MAKELRVFLWVLAIGVIMILVLKYMFPLMAPFLLGSLFACLIEPLVKKIDARWKVGRKLAVIIILVFLVLGIFAITGLSLLTFYQEAQRLIPRVPELAAKMFGMVQGWSLFLHKYLPQLNGALEDHLLPAEAVDRLFRSLIIGALSFLPRLPQLLFSIGLGGLSAYFFSRDKKAISETFYRILPKSWQKATYEIKAEILTSVARFIRVECTLALISTVLTTAVFTLSGAPGALAYGFLAGIFDFLPVLGPGLVYIPLIFINLLYQNFWQALWLLFAYFLALILRQAIEYKLIGEKLDLHPILSVLVLYIGINIFGFLGIFFGPLMMVVLRAFYRAMVGFENV